MKQLDLNSLFLGFFVAVMLMMSYVGYEKQFIRQNEEEYIQAGMAELHPGLFAPLYRRNK
jgi:hypothetical protein